MVEGLQLHYTSPIRHVWPVPWESVENFNSLDFSKIWIFEQNLDFWENFYFWPKFQLLSKISIFAKNQFLTKVLSFDTEISVPDSYARTVTISRTVTSMLPVLYRNFAIWPKFISNNFYFWLPWYYFQLSLDICNWISPDVRHYTFHFTNFHPFGCNCFSFFNR